MPGKNAALFAAIDEAARYKYHQIYQDLGLVQAKTGNFHCCNGGSHGSGQDNNASLSINNETGQYRCHGGSCGIKGNLSTFFKQFVAGGSYDKWDGHYTEFAKDYFNLKFMDSDSEEFKKIEKEAKNLDFKKLVSPIAKAASIKYFPQEENDVLVNTLIRMPDMMKTLRDARNWDESLIQKYRIGFHTKQNAITFPIIDAFGNISNIKLYRPWKKPGEAWRWQALIAGNPIHPTPVQHLTHNKIYIFEGEPDVYMAASMGLYGITSGSASNFDYKKLFGEERFKQTFQDKIIVIVPDCDDSGSKFTSVVSNQFIEVAQQVKIINLDKSDANPLGLDPKDVFEHNGKKKRKQKDVTDFFRKNGFTEEAKSYFLNLESSTIAFASDRNRRSTRMFKVSLNESLDSKYYDRNGDIHLETLANVQDVDSSVYKAPTQVCVSCPAMFDKNELSGMCGKCSMPKLVAGFGSEKRDCTFDFIPNYFRPVKTRHEIQVKSKDILELIATTEKMRFGVKKRLLKIPERCGECEIDDVAIMSIQEVTLIKDMEVLIEENTEEVADKRSNKLRLDQKNSTAAVTGYFVGENLAVDSIKANQCYRLKAVQTNIPDKQDTALFCYSVTPQKDSFESFKMSQDMMDMFKVFQPKKGETIAQHFARRYGVFGGASGIDGRQDVFMLCDWAYFSPTEIDVSILPGISRGWVEVLIAGDTRCGKSVAAEFLYSHYRIGQFIGGSRAVTTTGLLGGIVQSHNKPTISWGVLPQNDKGMVIFDEMSRMPPSELSAMTDMRSSGIVEIAKIVRGKAAARVRKIFMSNWRENDPSINKSDLGINNIRKLCGSDPVVSRFDAAITVRSSDILNFKMDYNKISSEFTSFQCRNLLMWTYSRTTKQYKYEEGFFDMVNESQDYMLASFHQDTQLVNQETRAKLIRLACATAASLASTDGDDYETVLVKKEHLAYVVEGLMRLYGKGSNVGLYEFTESIRGHEQLGDMKFMMNILDHIDIDTVMSFTEGYERDISFLFADYLLGVVRSDVKMVDGKTNKTSSGYRMNEALDKLIGTLFARNCFVRIKNRMIKKTDCFNEWLIRRKEQGDAAEKSNILECNESEPDTGCGVQDGHNRRDIVGNRTT